jgi:hypothetical protein
MAHIRPLMKCGHTAQTEDAHGLAVCVICFGIDPGSVIVAERPVILDGRLARCSDCGKTRPSRFTLPFFRHNPASQDTFFCGCRGWD